MDKTIAERSCRKVCELCDGEPIGEFVLVDYILFGAVLVVSALIGVFYMCKEYFASKNSTADDVLMGGRDIGIFPIAMSLMASFMSAITVLGTPTEMYNNNTSYWVVGMTMVITVPITNHVFIPFYHSLSLTSAYEYLEKRFSRSVRVCASVIFTVNMLLYMGVVLYAPALALNQVTGLSLELSIVCIGVVCTFYTALGGLKAVVWSDTFQTFVVMAGLIAIIIQGSIDLGGIDKVWEIADKGGRIKFIDWSGDPTTRHSVWALFIGSVFGQLTIYAANQTMIQRYLAIKEIKNSQKALYLSLPITLILHTVVCLVGLVIYATYNSCDPFLLKMVHARDQLLPFLVMDKLTFLPGLPGLFVACLFSASLSSISSGLNALAIVILEDILKLIWKKTGTNPSTEWQARIAKILGFVCGAMVIGIAFLSRFLGQTVLQACCMTGWLSYRGRCYLFSKHQVTWDIARAACNKMGGWLVTAESKSKNRWLKLQAFLIVKGSAWMGGNDLFDDSVWMWVHNAGRFKFTDWAPSEPNGKKRENCLHLFQTKHYMWNDESCNTKMGYICEK